MLQVQTVTVLQVQTVTVLQVQTVAVLQVQTVTTHFHVYTHVAVYQVLHTDHNLLFHLQGKREQNHILPVKVGTNPQRHM